MSRRRETALGAGVLRRVPATLVHGRVGRLRLPGGRAEEGGALHGSGRQDVAGVSGGSADGEESVRMRQGGRAGEEQTGAGRAGRR